MQKIRKFYWKNNNYRIGVFFYNESTKQISDTVLNTSVDRDNFPIMLGMFLDKGITVINPKDAFRYIIKNRVVPPERQNIKEILRRYHLPEYDEMQILFIGKGRCNYDNMCLEEVPFDNKLEF